ncbi:MAG: hypothetical protein EB100_07175 [Crocinitomicaceae bacterium]|nr:hypothetical protein [Crocinitomicaceae bacterium]
MKKGLFLSVLLIGATTVQGQNLDLETCLKMADTANLTIRAARLESASNAEQVHANLSTLLPKIAFNADYRYNAVIPGQVVPGQLAGGPPGSFTTVLIGDHILQPATAVTPLSASVCIVVGFIALCITR